MAHGHSVGRTYFFVHVLAVLNSHLYRQHWNKIEQIWMPKLRIRVRNSHFPWVLVYTCFTGQYVKMHQNTQPRRRIQAKHMQKPIHTPHRSRTPAQQRPRPRLGPPFSGGAFNARGGGCMWCFPKIPSKPTSSSLYKKTPLHIQKDLTHNKRREEEKSYTPILVLAKFSIGSEWGKESKE